MVERPFSADLQRNFRDQTGCPGAPKIIDDELPAQAVILMGANFDGSNALYTRDGTFDTPFASNQTFQVYNRNGVATGSVFYTVTAGKNFYCTAYNVANGGVAGTFQIGGGTNATSVFGWLNANGTFGQTQQKALFVVPGGSNVTIAHGFGGALGYAWIAGYEQ